MLSRERILAAIEHREADRVPVDLGATPSSGISAIAYRRLMDHLGIPGRSRIYDVVQQLAMPEEAVLNRFGVDVVDIAQIFCDGDEWLPVQMADSSTGYYPRWFHPTQTENGNWQAFDSEGTLIATMPCGATFFDQSCFPWAEGYPEGRKAMEETLDAAMEKVLWQKLVHSPWDRAGEDGFWGMLREKVKTLRAGTDRALMVVCGCNLYEWGTFLRRMDNFLMDLYTDQKNVAVLMELLMERHLKTLEKLCGAVGDLVDIVRFGDDLGMDSGPFMGLDVYRELFHDHRKKLCSYVHENSSMHTFLHSCGSVAQYIPDFIDEGIEIINPVQTNCLGMDASVLKKDYGKDIVFWGGGADPRRILNNGTPDEVKADVLSRLEIFAPGGGYVFNTIHNILPDVPPENVVALFEAVDEFNGGKR